MEYTAMGDAINLAARMEQTAKPGTVQIADATYRLIASQFEIEPLGPIAVKGKDHPINAYRVLGRHGTPGRRRALQHEAPLAGRVAEIASLRAALDGVLAGRGRLVFLTGEAGLGKSRLVRELNSAWEAALARAGQAGRWCETAGLSYEVGQPYGLFQRLVRAACGAAEDEAADTLRDKLAGLAALLPPGHDIQALTALKALFDLPVRPGETLLEGEAFKQQLFRLMPLLVQAWTAAGPLALVFDDLHWADPASLVLLDHLLPLAASQRLLLVGAMRPDQEAPAWALRAAAERSHAADLTLVEVLPLSPADSETLVDCWLDSRPEPVAPELRARILSQAEGNPLFIEEVAHALSEPNQPGGALEIPATLQSLLAARIDRLPEEARRTLQVAAVLGRAFEHRALSAMLEPGAQLNDRLQQLVQAGLIQAAPRRPGAEAETEFTFRHALVQEAAYQTILRKHRRDFHARAGEALETVFPHRVEQTAPTLAFHFAEAGDFARALKYAILAGDAAYRLFANAEAIGHYTRAAELARRTGAASDALRHIYLRRGRALELSSQYKAALDTYAELEALGQHRADPALVLSAVAAQGQIRAMGSNSESDPTQAEALLARALHLSRDLSDREIEARIEWSRLQLYNWLGRLPEALAAGERSLALARELGLHEQLAFTLTDLSYVHVAHGETRRAHASTDEAIALWRQLNNQPLLANSLTFASILSTQNGEAAAAIAFSDEAYQISAAIGNRWGMAFSRTAVGLTWWDRGEPTRAISLMQTAIADAEQAGFIVPRFTTRSFLAQLYAELGDTARAYDLLQAIDEQAARLPGITRFAHLIAATRIDVNLQAGNQAEAQAIAAASPALFDQAASRYVPGGALHSVGLAGSLSCQLQLAQSQPARAVVTAEQYLDLCQALAANRFVPELLFWRGLGQAALGQPAAARDTWQRARAAAEGVESRRLLWPVRFALAGVEAHLGKPADAVGLAHAARAVVSHIAERAEPIGLRETFLQRVEKFLQTLPYPIPTSD
jgi:tetratricopeptide (TPR) repeat protein